MEITELAQAYLLRRMEDGGFEAKNIKGCERSETKVPNLIYLSA